MMLAMIAVAALSGVALAGPGHDHAAHGGDDAVAADLAELESMCAGTADARAARQAETPLYQRLGGYEKIHAMTTEVVRLHQENEAISHLLEGVDTELLASRVADFVSAGTGGSEEYTGRDMVSAHAHLALTDADFLAAGGDIVTAMSSQGHGQEEIEEIVCILVSLKDQVVLD
jgi:hemoglobin